MEGNFKYGSLREKIGAEKRERTERYARYEAALKLAYTAADVAQAPLQDRPNALDCGFAWVVSHDKAFNLWCRRMAKAHPEKRMYYGSKHYAGGWSFWCPGNFNGQSIHVHEAGAKAFRDSLAHALQAHVEMGSRLD